MRATGKNFSLFNSSSRFSHYCCSVWYPSPSWRGGGGTPVPARGVPLYWGTPRSEWVTPGQDWGIPLGQDWGTPCKGPGTGVPPGKILGPETRERTWDWGIPWKGPGTTDQAKNLGLGYSPRKDQRPRKEPGTVGTPVDRQTDACENITFPSTTYAGSNNFELADVYFTRCTLHKIMALWVL